MTLRRTMPLLACLAVVFGAARAADWPQFRGPGGGGDAGDAKAPAEWGPDKNVQWKVAVPGVAWSSPIVVGDKVFVTTAVSDKQKKPKPGGGMGGMGGGGFKPGEGGKPPFKPGEGKPGGFKPGGGMGGMFGNQKPPDAVYRWQVVCLDRATGKTLWTQTAAEGKPTIPTHSTNTYASETPVSDGERVYAYFGPAGLYCYDLAGKLIWKKGELASYKMMFGFGTGSSPALDGGRLFVQLDNEEKSALVALDKKTGDELWRTERDKGSSWSTPFVWKTKARTELVCLGGKKARSYDPATGKQLWELGGMEGGSSATPVAGDDMLFFGTSSPFGGAPLFGVKAGASGDISLKDGKTSNDFVAWFYPKAGPYMASPLFHEGYLYVLEPRGGMITCYEAKTGKPAYSRERLPGAKGFTSSPWVAGGKLFCLDEDGQCFVVKAGPEFKLLGKNKLDEMFWSTPAVAGDALLLRGVDHLYCVK